MPGQIGYNPNAASNALPNGLFPRVQPGYRDPRYSSAVYDNPDFYSPALFGQGEDVNNMVALFASIFGDPKNRMAGINKQYDVAAGNLMQRGATARGQAMSAAGGQAGSRGLLNPSAFINQAGSQAYNPFVNALGGLEEQRAGALSNYDQQMRQMLLQLVTGAKQKSIDRD